MGKLFLCLTENVFPEVEAARGGVLPSRRFDAIIKELK